MQVQDNLEHILSASRNRRQHRRQPAAAAAPPVNESSILADLLLKATDKRNQELEVSVLRRIKALCRKSEEHIRAVHDYLLHALEANHAQVRFHAMELCDQLFQRSHLFRHLTTQHLPQILEHAVGTKASRPLPGPPHVATRLHEKALESIDQWADKYGAYYQQLRVTMRYLKDVLQMRFPQLRAQAAAAEAEARVREARAQEILREKLATIVGTYDETSREILSTLAQMDEAFELLMPKPEQAQRSTQRLAAQDEDDLEWEDVAAGDAADGDEADEEDAEGLSEYRDTAVPEDLLGRTSVVQNPDPAVLETLRELNQLLGGSHMRTVNEWLRVLTQVVTGESGSDEDREREQLLQRATELRGSITRAQDRYGAIMDAFKTAEEITLGMPPKQERFDVSAVAMQKADASAEPQQGPKEAVPPWLASQQPNLADLFGASSSDEEQAPEQAVKPAAAIPTKASPDTAHLGTDSLQAARKGTFADSAAGAMQTDVSMKDYNDEEEGNTPKFGAQGIDAWDAVVSDEDAGKATPGASSADSDGPQPSDSAARERAADRGQNGSRNTAQANTSTAQETKKSSISESLKQALAAQAPVVPSGPHLAYWDSKDQALVNARGMQVYNHWGPVDEHKTLPTERLNELFGSMASYYKPPSKQELLSAGKRKAEPERPSFTDEPLEGQKQKRPRVPVTPILPPAIAKLMATSVSASQPQASSTAGAAVKTAAQAAPAADSIPAEPEQTPSAEQPGESAQRAAYMWPSQAPSEKPLNVEREGANSGSLPNGKAASNQAIEVEELEWKPGDAAGPFAGDTVEALPLPVDERREESPPLTQTRAGRARDPEKPSKGQRALDKAYNDAVLAEAASKDPILAHRWAAHQASKAEKTKKAQGAKKKLGVRASLARKLLSKRAVMSAAHDMSTHEAEAHQDLNTNRWEEK